MVPFNRTYTDAVYCTKAGTFSGHVHTHHQRSDIVQLKGQVSTVPCALINNKQDE